MYLRYIRLLKLVTYEFKSVISCPASILSIFYRSNLGTGSSGACFFMEVGVGLQIHKINTTRPVSMQWTLQGRGKKGTKYRGDIYIKL